MKHSRGLDGLRGLAILFVVLFHFGFLGAGWIGVQVFFVLSGFLITTILIADRGRPAAQFFKRFYWRRSLRIFPLYFGYLLVLAVIFALWRVPVEFGERWGYLFSYTYNYALLLAPLRQSVTFTHFWSLAVEEQFYLLWPFVIYFLSSRSVKSVVVAVLVCSPLIRYVAVLVAQALVPSHIQPGLYAYSPLPAQWDSLAIGAGLALVGVDRIAAPMKWLGFATALFLGAGALNAWLTHAEFARGVLGYPAFSIGGYQHIWSYTIVNVWSAALLAAVVKGGWLSSIFEHRVLTYSGQISYGLYVLHYPILGLIRRAVTFDAYSLEGLIVFGGYVVVLYVVAAVSFRYYESKFLEFKDAYLR